MRAAGRLGQLAVILGLLAMGGCQTTPAAQPVDPSEYPKTLSLSAKKTLARYNDEPFPLAFVIARDGGYATYWRCSNANCTRSDASYIEAVQKSCRQFGHQGDCLVHSIRNRKVWPVPETFETGVRSRVIVPWKFDNAGPDQAKGVVLYVPGYGGHRFPPALNHERVPTYLRTLNRRGYDTVRLNVAHYDMGIQNDNEINQRIAETIIDLKKQGYAKVFLAGQSRGSWQLLGTMRNELQIDGAILMVPAAHGREESWSGKPNKRFAKGKEDFRKLMTRVGNYPLLLGFFSGDQYDPGDRVATLQQVHGARFGKTMFVLDQPSDLAGHGAAWQGAFAHAYQDCLISFMDGKGVDFQTCERPLDPENEAHAATRAQFVARGAKPVTGDDLDIFASGRVFHPTRGNPGWWGMLARPDGTMLHWFPGSYLSGNTLESKWEVDEDKLCVVESQRHNSKHYCFEVWAMASGNIGFVAPDGLAFVVSSAKASSVKDLEFTPGDWKGEKLAARTE